MLEVSNGTKARLIRNWPTDFLPVPAMALVPVYDAVLPPAASWALSQFNELSCHTYPAPDSAYNATVVGAGVGVGEKNAPSSVAFVIFPTASRSYENFASVSRDFVYVIPVRRFTPS